MLGRIQPEFFPHVFGSRADEGARSRRRRAAVRRVGTEHVFGPNRSAANRLRPVLLQIAVGNMANAVKRISVARGYDVTRYTLQCFGGAAGQHACLVADALGLEHVFCHPLAGVLSALGMGLADQIADAPGHARIAPERIGRGESASARRGSRTRRCRGTRDSGHFPLPAARPRACSLRGHGYRDFVRAAGGGPVELGRERDPGAVPIRGYRRRFAFLMPHLDLVIESVSVECIGGGEHLAAVAPQAGTAGAATAATPESAPPSAVIDVRMYCLADEVPAGWRTARLVEARALAVGASLEGPGIIAEPNSTIVVEPGWRATLTELGNLELRRVRSAAGCSGSRQPCRSRNARGLQQSVHEYRRANGAAAAEHRAFGQQSRSAWISAARYSTPQVR